ncbi:MAG: hypothetical protein R3250_13575, partial [Melioribacteraceae bacterium]|nr:hypothetical protein [Melioribacteraceae bacterium]
MLPRINNVKISEKSINLEINTNSIFNTFLNSTSDVLIITNRDGVIIEISRQALVSLDISNKNSLLGKDVKELFSGTTLIRMSNFIKQTINNGFYKSSKIFYTKPS